MSRRFGKHFMYDVRNADFVLIMLNLTGPVRKDWDDMTKAQLFYYYPNRYFTHFWTTKNDPGQNKFTFKLVVYVQKDVGITAIH